MGPGYDIEDVTCIAESRNGKNLLMEKEDAEEFEGEDGGAEDGKYWVAKYQITNDSEVYEKGGTGTLSVTERYAEKVGWL